MQIGDVVQRPLLQEILKEVLQAESKWPQTVIGSTLKKKKKPWER